jgi:hypothetical protein
MKQDVWTMTGLAIGALMASTSFLQAQQNCAPRDRVIERLASAYGETRQSIGLGQNNTMVEVFASVESGSWTITVTSAGGLTCLVASGQAFELVSETLPTPAEDAYVSASQISFVPVRVSRM